MCENSITKNKKAFLLVEVLITVVVLSIGLVAITRSFMTSLKALDIIAQYEKARWLLEEKLWDLEIKDAIEADLQTEENFPEPNDRFKYRLETENIEEDDEPGPLNNVKLSVNWPSRKEIREISIATYLKNKE
ncbi:MAG: type II secretion system protein [Candidatus Omnitrophota bacterium]